MRKTTAILPLLLGAGLIPVAQAEGDESMFMLGLGVGSEESIYEGVGTETSVIPMIAWEKGSFYLHGPEVGYYFVDAPQLRLGTLVRYRGEGYDSGDSDELAGMDDRDGAFELGLTISYDTEYGEWSATALSDISSEHEGYELELGWEKRIRLSPDWSLTPEASISYRSDDLNNYYYGVTAGEATAQRAVYTADGDMVYEIGINADYRIDQHQMIRFGASYQHYGSEISDSSIVEDDNSYALKAMYVYRF